MIYLRDGKTNIFLAFGQADEGKEAAPTECRDINHIASGIGIDHRATDISCVGSSRQHCCTAAAHFALIATGLKGVNPLISTCQKSSTKY